MTRCTSPEHYDSTRSRNLRQCRRIFNVAKEWGYIRKNPFDGIKLGKINKDNWHALTIEEFNLVLNAVDKYARVTEKNRNTG
jgi:site-specific recombinase XerD